MLATPRLGPPLLLTMPQHHALMRAGDCQLQVLAAAAGSNQSQRRHALHAGRHLLLQVMGNTVPRPQQVHNTHTPVSNK